MSDEKPAVNWWPGDRSGVRRGSFIRPGYICPDDHPECREKASLLQHGRHGDEWHYIVTDGRFALTLSVFTSDYKDRKLAWPERPRGADLSGHATRPTNENELRYAPNGRQCDFIDQGRCYTSGSTALGADEFFARWGSRVFAQTDLFWRAMEEKWAEWKADHEKEPVRRQCGACSGTGVVTEGV